MVIPFFAGVHIYIYIIYALEEHKTYRLNVFYLHCLYILKIEIHIIMYLIMCLICLIKKKFIKKEQLAKIILLLFSILFFYNFIKKYFKLSTIIVYFLNPMDFFQTFTSIFSVFISLTYVHLIIEIY